MYGEFTRDPGLKPPSSFVGLLSLICDLDASVVHYPHGPLFPMISILSKRGFGYSSKDCSREGLYRNNADCPGGIKQYPPSKSLVVLVRPPNGQPVERLTPRSFRVILGACWGEQLPTTVFGPFGGWRGS